MSPQAQVYTPAPELLLVVETVLLQGEDVILKIEAGAGYTLITTLAVSYKLLQIDVFTYKLAVYVPAAVNVLIGLKMVDVVSLAPKSHKYSC